MKQQFITKEFSRPNGNGREVREIEVELFTWEKLDLVADVKKAFGIA
jgi:S-adenosylmethionine synthetase